MSAICGGKGGGKPDSAMGGGTELLKVDDALAAVDDFVAEKSWEVKRAPPKALRAGVTIGIGNYPKGDAT